MKRLTKPLRQILLVFAPLSLWAQNYTPCTDFNPNRVFTVQAPCGEEFCQFYDLIDGNFYDLSLLTGDKIVAEGMVGGGEYYIYLEAAGILEAQLTVLDPFGTPLQDGVNISVSNNFGSFDVSFTAEFSGNYEVIISDEFNCSDQGWGQAISVLSIEGFDTPCTVYSECILSESCVPGLSSQLSFDVTPFTINLFGAPCQEGDFRQLSEEIFGGYGYEISNFEAGATYRFELVGGGNWIPNFTVYDDDFGNPANDVVIWGSQGENDPYAIEFVSPLSGTLYIDVSIAGFCDDDSPFGFENLTNGFPRLTCIESVGCTYPDACTNWEQIIELNIVAPCDGSTSQDFGNIINDYTAYVLDGLIAGSGYTVALGNSTWCNSFNGEWIEEDDPSNSGNGSAWSIFYPDPVSQDTILVAYGKMNDCDFSFIPPFDGSYIIAAYEQSNNGEASCGDNGMVGSFFTVTGFAPCTTCNNLSLNLEASPFEVCSEGGSVELTLTGVEADDATFELRYGDVSFGSNFTEIGVIEDLTASDFPYVFDAFPFGTTEEKYFEVFSLDDEGNICDVSLLPAQFQVIPPPEIEDFEILLNGSDNAVGCGNPEDNLLQIGNPFLSDYYLEFQFFSDLSLANPVGSPFSATLSFANPDVPLPSLANNDGSLELAVTYLAANDQNGCGQAIDPISIASFLSLPEVLGDPNVNEACQGGSSPILTLENPSPQTGQIRVEYTINGVGQTPLIFFNSSTIEVPTTNVGNVEVVLTEVSYANVTGIGCPVELEQTFDFEIIENVPLTFSNISDAESICPGGSFDLPESASGGITGQWSPSDYGNPGDYVFTADEGQGCFQSFTLSISEEDEEAPLVTCPSEQIDLTLSNGTATIDAPFILNTIFGGGGLSDNCSSLNQLTFNLSQSSFDINDVGQVIDVELTVNDEAGNPSDPCTLQVNVLNNPPNAVCTTQNVILELGANGSVEIDPSELDAGSTNPNGNTNGLSLSIFGSSTLTCADLGPNEVTLAVTWQGATATCDATVVVEDNLSPSIVNCPDIISMGTDQGECTAIVDFATPTAEDNCPNVIIEQTAGPSSGTAFPVGSTEVTFTATDQGGNTDTCSFNVEVTDTEPPVFTDCPGIIPVNTDDGQCSALVNFPDPVATDNCSGVTVMQTAGPASGSTFPLGSTQVTFTATDTAGLTDICSFEVMVTDNQPPAFADCPGDIMVIADQGSCSAVVTFSSPAASDNCPGVAVEQSEGPASGSEFPLGSTPITFTATDTAGLTETCSFEVMVTDNQPPAFADCPADIMVNADQGSCTAVVTFSSPAASDNCPGVTVEQSEGLASGSTFPLGSTQVTFTATDTSGLTAECTFDVTVVDEEQPNLICPDDTLQQELELDGTLTLTLADFGDEISTGDNCQINTVLFAGNNSELSFTCADQGLNTISVVSTDDSGNQNTCSFSIEINDTNIDGSCCTAAAGFSDGWIPPTEVCYGEEVEIFFEGGVQDNPGVEITLTYSLNGMENSLSFEGQTSITVVAESDLIVNLTEVASNDCSTPLSVSLMIPIASPSDELCCNPGTIDLNGFTEIPQGDTLAIFRSMDSRIPLNPEPGYIYSVRVQETGSSAATYFDPVVSETGEFELLLLTGEIEPGEYQLRGAIREVGGLTAFCGLTDPVNLEVTQSVNTSFQRGAHIDWEIFPNPANDFMYMRLGTGKSESLLLILADLHGQTLLKQNLKSGVDPRTHEIELPDLANGTYIVQLRSENAISTKRLVIHD